MTTRQKFVAGLLVVIVGGGLLLYFNPSWLPSFLKWFDDEPPIRVHNGSLVMEAVIGEATFKGENGDADDSEASYSHETTAKSSSKKVFAVVSPTSSCQGDLTILRNEIVVTYHDDVQGDDQRFTFKRGKRDGVVATKVRPVRNDVTETATRLTYRSGLKGHISRVDLIGNGAAASCTFNAGDDPKIAICPTGTCRYN